ncbi:MAG: glycosyltransferase family 2 protein [Calditerrivibrio sp.]|nr:glycosyltransferase family 2 protein [Calditerrivibrio sp.]MCA1980049.1 glycosyltransferase family 2 protein [Calditerrivibrio sp.]
MNSYPKPKLSVAIITKNEEKKILKTLQSVVGIADEIIIVDNFSTDNTVEICKKFGATVFIEEWKGYGDQKNSAIEKCRGEWILMIDADEVVSESLANRIKKIINDEFYRDKVYSVRFKAHCFGKMLRFGGWDVIRVRLFPAQSGRYNSNKVHEEFITDKKIERISEYIIHYSYLDTVEYFSKFVKYTALVAENRLKAGKKVSFLRPILGSFVKFFKHYFLMFGFLDGFAGFKMCYYSSVYYFVKYAIFLEMEKK